MENHPRAQDAGVKMAAPLVDEVEQPGKRRRLLPFLKNIVVDGHRLGGLAGAGGRHRSEVDEVCAHRRAEPSCQAFRVLPLRLPADGAEHPGRLAGDVHRDDRIGEGKRADIVACPPPGRAPVAQPEGDEPVLSHPAREEEEVPENGGGVFLDNLQIAAVPPGEVGQVGQGAVPGRAGQAVIPPPAGRDDAGQGSVPCLGAADAAQPLAVALLRAQV